MSLTRIVTTFAAAAAVLTLASCATNASAGAESSGADAEPRSIIGTWTAESAEVPTLTFADDGTFTGNDGCVGYNGEWEQSGNEIAIKRMIAPAKACIGVDPWMSTARSFAIQEGVIEVKDRDGNVVGTLPRA